MSDSNQNIKVKKSKSSTKKYVMYGVLFALSICILVFAHSMYTSFVESSQKTPVYHNRCENIVYKISDAQLNQANSVVASNEDLVSSDIKVHCMTLDVQLKYKTGISLSDAKTKATKLVHEIDNAIGYEKLKDTDTYSKIFSDNGEDRVYDIEVTILCEDGSYTAHGNKHYQVEEIVYTDSAVTDQKLVDKLHAEQSQQTNE